MLGALSLFISKLAEADKLRGSQKHMVLLFGHVIWVLRTAAKARTKTRATSMILFYITGIANLNTPGHRSEGFPSSVKFIPRSMFRI